MEWQNFEESRHEYPEMVVESIVKGFDKATKNLARLIVVPISGIEQITSGLSTDFQFEVRLLSQTLSQYKLMLFKLGYDVNMYPVSVIFNTDIAEELYPSKRIGERTVFQLKNEEELILIIEKLVGTTFFKDTVSGLMKISLKYMKRMSSTEEETEEEEES